ncbi:hypothetical protein LTS08_003232 [Lithohypha guttulata]|nr:hypothetical protein LTS08_003232 [Lithohypha guttulata]
MEDKHYTTVQLTDLSSQRESEQDLVANENTQDVLPTKSWPQEPVPLVPEKTVSLMQNALDAGMVILSLLLIAKIALVIYAWKKDSIWSGGYIDLVSGLTTSLIEFNSQMVTAFTIVFVTIISTLVKRYALFKAEKGAYISDLEQLQGSVSLPSTFKLIWSLRAFSTQSVALVGIWCFYYLGSQASQREYALVTSNSYKKVPVGIPGPDYVSGFSSRWVPASTHAGLTVFKPDQINLVYTYADLVDYDYNRPESSYGTDSNGVALLPDLKYLLNPPLNVAVGWIKPGVNRHGWIDVSKQSQTQMQKAYSAMVGIQPYMYDKNAFDSAYSGKVVGKYTMRTSYLDVGCEAPQLHRYTDFPLNASSNYQSIFNMTTSSTATDANGQVLRQFYLWHRSMSPATEYASYTESSMQLLCKVSSINVEVEIRCKDTGCFPHAMRYFNGTSLETATSYSTPFDDDSFATNFLGNLTEIVAHDKTNQLNQYFEGLSIDNTTTQDDLNAQWPGANWQAPFEQVLKKAFNTYYILGQNHLSRQSAPDFSLLTATGSDKGYLLTIMKGAIYNPHYAIFWPWIAMDFVSCLILLVAAILSTWLRINTLAPDIFGYVSSLTRDNPNIDLPNNGTTLGGIERALMLKRVKIKIGDVSAPAEPNRVGLARVDSEVGRSRRHIEELKSTAAYV